MQNFTVTLSASMILNLVVCLKGCVIKNKALRPKILKQVVSPL